MEDNIELIDENFIPTERTICPELLGATRGNGGSVQYGMTEEEHLMGRNIAQLTQKYDWRSTKLSRKLSRAKARNRWWVESRKAD